MYVLLQHFSKKDDTRNPPESEANEKQMRKYTAQSQVLKNITSPNLDLHNQLFESTSCVEKRLNNKS